MADVAMEALAERVKRLSVEGKMTVAIALMQRNELELAENVIRMAADDLAMRRLMASGSRT